MTTDLTCQAHVSREPCTGGQIESVRVEAPRAGEVRVKVAAAGVCHSDLHMVDGHLSQDDFPLVLGHEGAGVVEAIGDGVVDWAVGDRVAFCFVRDVHAVPGRTGESLRTGPARVLRKRAYRRREPHARYAGGQLKQFLTIGRFGEYAVVPEQGLVRLPDGLGLWQAALIGCAVVTGVGAVRNAAGVAHGDSVRVVGCGGVGPQVIEGSHAALPALEFLTAEKSVRGSFYGSGRPRREIAQLAGLAEDGTLDIGRSISHRTNLAGLEAALQPMREGVGSMTVLILDPGLAGAEPA